jgi:hypothetical protein
MYEEDILIDDWDRILKRLDELDNERNEYYNNLDNERNEYYDKAANEINEYYDKASNQRKKDFKKLDEDFLKLEEKCKKLLEDIDKFHEEYTKNKENKVKPFFENKLNTVKNQIYLLMEKAKRMYSRSKKNKNVLDNYYNKNSKNNVGNKKRMDELYELSEKFKNLDKEYYQKINNPNNDQEDLDKLEKEHEENLKKITEKIKKITEKRIQESKDFTNDNNKALGYFEKERDKLQKNKYKGITTKKNIGNKKRMSDDIGDVGDFVLSYNDCKLMNSNTKMWKKAISNVMAANNLKKIVELFNYFIKNKDEIKKQEEKAFINFQKIAKNRVENNSIKLKNLSNLSKGLKTQKIKDNRMIVEPDCYISRSPFNSNSYVKSFFNNFDYFQVNERFNIEKDRPNFPKTKCGDFLNEIENTLYIVGSSKKNYCDFKITLEKSKSKSGLSLSIITYPTGESFPDKCKKEILNFIGVYIVPLVYKYFKENITIPSKKLKFMDRSNDEIQKIHKLIPYYLRRNIVILNDNSFDFIIKQKNSQVAPSEDMHTTSLPMYYNYGYRQIKQKRQTKQKRQK